MIAAFLIATALTQTTTAPVKCLYETTSKWGSQTGITVSDESIIQA